MGTIPKDSDLNKVILVTGGARSGKSRFAEQYAAKISLDSEGETVYLATAQIFDEEMRRRISQHKIERPSEWRTIEEPYDLESILKQLSKEKVAVVLIDCLTLWLSNLCLELNDEGQEAWTNPHYPALLLKRVDRLAQLIKGAPFTTLMVTNEVGASIIPENPLGRAYRDLLGHMNQMLAASSDEVFFVVCGFPINLRQITSLP